MKTNEEILLGVKRGDASDFELLYARYKEKLHDFILAASNYDYYLTEEVVQITFIKIWETRERIDMDKSFGSYITTIARNTLMTYYNHRKTERAYCSKFTYESLSTYETEEAVVSRLTLEHVNKIIKLIPPARQRIFVMSKKYGYSNKAIAQRLTLSENTVESQLTKAHLFMRRYKNVI